MFVKHKDPSLGPQNSYKNARHGDAIGVPALEGLGRRILDSKATKSSHGALKVQETAPLKIR